MGGCPSVVFNNLSAAGWACLKQKGQAYAAAHGHPITPGDSGSESYMGFSATWNYDAANLTLTITCTSHPLLLFSCNEINSKIQTGITGTGCLALT
jgi:hypothetical protein